MFKAHTHANRLPASTRAATLRLRVSPEAARLLSLMRSASGTWWEAVKFSPPPMHKTRLDLSERRCPPPLDKSPWQLRGFDDF